MPEFGPLWSPAGQGTPKLFASNEELDGSPCSAVSPVIPDGVTWLLQGADFWAADEGWNNVECFVFTATSTILWADSLPSIQASINNTFSEYIQLGRGTSWRGAVPFTPGQRIQVLCQGSGGPSYTSCGCWGVVLPYVVL